MNIVLDNIVYELQKSGGISALWYELTKKLVEQPDFDIRYIDNPQTGNVYRNMLSIPHEKVLKKSHFTALSRALPVKVSYSEPFIFHSSYYRFCTNPHAINITTVHDFTNEYFQHGWKKRVHSWQKNRAIRHSEVVVCVSESTKRDLLHFLPDVDERKVRVIHNSPFNDFHVVTQKTKSSDLPFPPGSFVLFVGNRASYKNFHLLARCVMHTPYNLVIVGNGLSDQEKQELERHVSPDRYRCLGFIPNEALNLLYNHAAALVYPSSYEGFGFPVIEAQLAGCPVIATNVSSIPEVIGSDILLMDSPTEEALLGKMQLLQDEPLMEQVRQAGFAHMKKFEYGAMQAQYIALYKELLHL